MLFFACWRFIEVSFIKTSGSYFADISILHPEFINTLHQCCFLWLEYKTLLSTLALSVNVFQTPVEAPAVTAFFICCYCLCFVLSFLFRKSQVFFSIANQATAGIGTNSSVKVIACLHLSLFGLEPAYYLNHNYCNMYFFFIYLKLQKP